MERRLNEGVRNCHRHIGVRFHVGKGERGSTKAGTTPSTEATQLYVACSGNTLSQNRREHEKRARDTLRFMHGYSLTKEQATCRYSWF